MFLLKKSILLYFLFLSLDSFSQSYQIDTLEYETIGGEKLLFDLYRFKKQIKKKRPTILFIHGGSFMNGSKNSPYVQPFAEAWVNEGYHVISMDYRLTLKGKSFHCDCTKEEKVSTFENAVYDIRALTKHILNLQKELKIDTKKIVLAGNSAGAEAALHVAFWDHNTHNIGKEILPENFKYAGVLSYAGAMVDTNLITEKNAIPIGLYHGNCDPYVPYKTAAHHYCPDSTVGALTLSGSYDIMQRYKNLNKNYYMYTMCQGTHRVNTLGMQLVLDETIDFVNATVLKKKKRQIHKVEKSSLKKCNFVELDACN